MLLPEGELTDKDELTKKETVTIQPGKPGSLVVDAGIYYVKETAVSGENILPPEMVPDAYRKAAGAVVLGDEMYFGPFAVGDGMPGEDGKVEETVPQALVNIENLGARNYFIRQTKKAGPFWVHILPLRERRRMEAEKSENMSEQCELKGTISNIPVYYTAGEKKGEDFHTITETTTVTAISFRRTGGTKRDAERAQRNLECAGRIRKSRCHCSSR